MRRGGAVALASVAIALALLRSALAGGVGSFTVEFVFKPVSTGGNNCRALANDHTDSDGKGFQIIGCDGAGFQADVGFSGGTAAITGNAPYTAGSTDLVDLVYDSGGKTLTLYVNGGAIGSAATSGNYNPAGYDTDIGRNPSYNGDYDNAYFTDVAFYPAALTASQVSADYSALGSGTLHTQQISNGAAHQYRLDESSGTTATDHGAAAGYPTSNGTYYGGYTLCTTPAIAGDLSCNVLLNGSTGYVDLGFKDPPGQEELSSSKLVTFGTLQASQTNTSKLVAGAVLLSGQANTSKLVANGVLLSDQMNISKLVAYAVLQSVPNRGLVLRAPLTHW